MWGVAVTGTPGVGKTTLIQNICQTLSPQIPLIKGFITEEVRQNNHRIGFDLIDLSHPAIRVPLARVSDRPQSTDKCVGRFVVNITAFEEFVLPLVRDMATPPAQPTLLVIDEIGKMELLSAPFTTAIKQLLATPLPTAALLCSVALNSGSFISEFKRSKSIELIELSVQNRNQHTASIPSKLQEIIKNGSIALPSPLPVLEPVYTSTVAIVPPVSVWPPIQALRKQYHSVYNRWMPHINILYPFLPEIDGSFEIHVQNLSKALTDCHPFHVELSGVGKFSKGNSGAVVYAAPTATPAKAFDQMYAKLRAVFPECAKKSQFTPHLTLGDGTQVEAAFAEFQRNWQSISFQVNEVYLLTRDPRNKLDSFHVRAVIPLSGGTPNYANQSNLDVLVWGHPYADLL